MTYQTPATLTDEERDYLVSALKERGITPEKWNESRQLLAEFFEFVNDNRDYLKRLGNYVTREVEKDPRQGEAVFEDTYIEDILSRAIEAMEAPGEQKSLGLLMNGRRAKGQQRHENGEMGQEGRRGLSNVHSSESWCNSGHNDNQPGDVVSGLREDWQGERNAKAWNVRRAQDASIRPTENDGAGLPA